MQERKLLARLDASLIPAIMLAYLACFLDRSNIGNVKVAGMPKDIGASTQQFSTAVSIFYATYVTFELPWAVALKRLTPHYQLTILCLVWSLTTLCSGWITNIGGLYATRLILGACEAGLFPSLNLYLTTIYRREEQARRVSYLFVCSAISGAFGGLLAYGLLHMDEILGYHGWQWVYIIEGIFSFAVAAVVWKGLPNDPADAFFLKAEDKKILDIRTTERAACIGDEKFTWDEILNAFRDAKVWLSGATQFCQDILLYGFSTFLPSVIQSMGYTSLQAQYLIIPVYIVGGICFLVFAVLSDKFQIRGLFIVFANSFGILGYVLLICRTSEKVKYFATFLCAIAVYAGPGLNLTWLNVNIAPHYRRAAAIGLQQSIGNSAGVVVGQIYRRSPYFLGNSFSLGALCVAQILIITKYLYIKLCNKRKQLIANSQIEDTRKIGTGDQGLDFIYHL
ncbi:MFS general substrate transporter [Myriangium duriaei CBS 260.36]|uniref:MFS general substrate transporter n=1 Tax=Myriangium duriaei CBS 260.36 TaxID=1168546 RepID=A0A9P4IQ32_9PEZI|nr:MFS general substrate transporter [Myriangium duriaei CBS 260.36]